MGTFKWNDLVRILTRVLKHTYYVILQKVRTFSLFSMQFITYFSTILLTNKF
jgi:hypothetical protein